MSEREKIVKVIAGAFDPLAMAIPEASANESVLRRQAEALVKSRAAFSALEAAGYAVVKTSGPQQVVVSQAAICPICHTPANGGMGDTNGVIKYFCHAGHEWTKAAAKEGA